MCIALQKNHLKSLLKKAQENKKRYEWVQVAENYRKAVDFFSDTQSIEVAELLERMGFSFYKAAMQASNNAEFRKRIHLAIQAYEKELKLLEGIKKENSHVLALISYTRSCLETNPSKKKKLLDKWWNFEKQAKEEFLPKITEGDACCGIAVTEPEGGSGVVGASKAKAEKKGKERVLNGEKIFISGITESSNWGGI